MTDAVAIADLDLDLDLSALEFVDAHGIGAFAELVGRLTDRGRDVRIQRVPDHARRIIGLVAPVLEKYYATIASAEHDRK